jgi:short-subunit dehydrogenase
VIVVGRNADRGAQTVQEIAEAGGRARFIAANLDNPDGIQRLALEAGEIDVLVNNAGHSVWGPTEQLKVYEFDSMFASNVRAPYFLVAAFAPAMAARGTGSIISIINISSMSGSLGLPTTAAYGATKAALASLTQGWTALLRHPLRRHRRRIRQARSGCTGGQEACSDRKLPGAWAA